MSDQVKRPTDEVRIDQQPQPMRVNLGGHRHNATDAVAYITNANGQVLGEIDFRLYLPNEGIIGLSSQMGPLLLIAYGLQSVMSAIQQPTAEDLQRIDLSRRPAGGRG